MSSWTAASAYSSGTYVGEGHLDHGYAITAHRAQGATVDRAFVLGSEELYREWGYTALSRHREEARFYVARRDLDHGRDLPQQDGYEIERIKDLLTRSNAKGLAIDELPAVDRDELERERHVLEQRVCAGAATRPRPRSARAQARRTRAGRMRPHRGKPP